MRLPLIWLKRATSRRVLMTISGGVGCGPRFWDRGLRWRTTEDANTECTGDIPFVVRHVNPGGVLGSASLSFENQHSPDWRRYFNVSYQ